MKYTLKLIKVKQNDTQILYQIISDMDDRIDKLCAQNEKLTKENVQLKELIQLNKKQCILGSWSSNGTMENNHVYVFVINFFVHC